MSTQRRCDVYLAVDGKWYMKLGKFEYAERDSDCLDYGPFETQEAALDYLDDNFSNPGGWWQDSKGTAPVPAKPINPTWRPRVV